MGQGWSEGAVNLITPAKRASAATLANLDGQYPLRTLSRLPYLRVNERETCHSFVDRMEFEYRGVTVTHVDALCHMWDGNGM